MHGKLPCKYEITYRGYHHEDHKDTVAYHGSYDGSFCLAAVDGEPVSLVSRASVIELVEAVQGIVLNKTA